MPASRSTSKGSRSHSRSNSNKSSRRSSLTNSQTFEKSRQKFVLEYVSDRQQSQQPGQGRAVRGAAGKNVKNRGREEKRRPAPGQTSPKKVTAGKLKSQPNTKQPTAVQKKKSRSRSSSHNKKDKKSRSRSSSHSKKDKKSRSRSSSHSKKDKKSRSRSSSHSKKDKKSRSISSKSSRSRSSSHEKSKSTKDIKKQPSKNKTSATDNKGKKGSTSSPSKKVVKNKSKSRSRSRSSSSSSSSRSKDRTTKRFKKNLYLKEIEQVKKDLNEVKKKNRQENPRPSEKDYTPNVYNDLWPYTDTHSLDFIMNKNRDRYYPVSKFTATRLIDPWEEMADKKPAKRIKKPKTASHEEKKPKEKENEQQDEDNKNEDGEKRERPEGSVRLPQMPILYFDTNTDYWKGPISFDELHQVRELIRDQYTSNGDAKRTKDYKKTKDDFYRMKLDKLGEVNKTSRRNVAKAYYAYLQNTPGSKKALDECMTELSKILHEDLVISDDEEYHTVRSGKKSHRTKRETDRSNSHRAVHDNEDNDGRDKEERSPRNSRDNSPHESERRHSKDDTK